MSRPRNHRLHNLELKAMIAHHQQRADLATLVAADCRFWQVSNRRRLNAEATREQAIADALRHAMAGGRNA